MNPSSKSIFLRVLSVGVALSVLHVLMERLMAFAASDVAKDMWVRPLNIAIILCDAAFFFLLYGWILQSIRSFGTSSSLSSILLVIAITLFKHLGNWMAFLVTENITQAVTLRLSFMTAASSIAIELLQYGAVLAVAIWGKRKPIQTRLLFVCGILLFINLLSRLIGDVEYGAPATSAEIWIMVAYYAADIGLYGPIAYLTMHSVVKE